MSNDNSDIKEKSRAELEKEVEELNERVDELEKEKEKPGILERFRKVLIQWIVLISFIFLSFGTYLATQGFLKFLKLPSVITKGGSLLVFLLTLFVLLLVYHEFHLK